MRRTDDILATVRMFQEEHLDVRTVTMGIHLFDCASPDVDLTCKKIAHKIKSKAANLVKTCDRIGSRYGIPIVNKRIAVSPIASVAAGHGPSGLLAVAKAIDQAAKEVGVDFIGGFSALVHKGMTDSDVNYFEALPNVLSETDRVCASVNVATSRAGINMDAIIMVSEAIKKAANLSADKDGFACAKLVTFANIPEDNPFMAGAYLGIGEPECVVNIGVSGPGVVKRSVDRLRESGCFTLGDLAEEIKSTAFRVTRVGELIGREVAGELGVSFGIVDLSLAPTPTVGDSVGEILQAMGINHVGGPGSTAALALLTDAVKKGGTFASSSVGGLSGAFIPVAEDSELSRAVADGHLSLDKLEAMTSVCSVGLDMVAVPGDTPAETLAALIADEMAIGVINHKTTAVRVIPVPGKGPGEIAEFGGLFGRTAIMEIDRSNASRDFVLCGGRIPAPLHSLKN